MIVVARVVSVPLGMSWRMAVLGMIGAVIGLGRHAPGPCLTASMAGATPARASDQTGAIAP